MAINYVVGLMGGRQITSENPFGPDLQKYWDRRYELFSRFDEGIRLDRDSLFSVKPELVSIQIASRIAERSIVDGMCGAGGSAIGFARLGKSVTAIDIDEKQLEMARHNASIYEVVDQITFVRADLRDYLSNNQVRGALYLDPPWGGPDYYKLRHFGFEQFEPPVTDLIASCTSRGTPVAITVPKNFDMNEFMQFKADLELIHSYSRKERIFSTALMRS
jgi:trimethylguanosine synthase